ncbi:MAG: hypothetical protein ACTSQY_08255 [Candidatus Odinarchaeia archaeon]
MKNWVALKKQLLSNELFNMRERLEEIITAKDVIEKHIISLKSNLLLLEEVAQQIDKEIKEEDNEKDGGAPKLS